MVQVAILGHFEDVAAPDFTHYPDKGCEFSPKCLDCPLPSCILDIPGSKRQLRREARAKQFAELRAHGKTIAEIVHMFNASYRTVARVLGQK